MELDNDQCWELPTSSCTEFKIELLYHHGVRVSMIARDVFIEGKFSIPFAFKCTLFLKNLTSTLSFAAGIRPCAQILQPI
jgi:hypothetical protein